MTQKNAASSTVGLQRLSLQGRLLHKPTESVRVYDKSKIQVVDIKECNNFTRFPRDKEVSFRPQLTTYGQLIST